MDEANFLFLASILALGILTIPAHSFYSTHHHVPVKEKMTRIKIYIHDILSGEKPTAVLIARPNNTRKEDGPTPFGTLFAVDDPLTDGPDLNKSKIVGNAKGMYLSSSQDKNKFSLVMYLSLGFTEGELRGSTLSVFSRNPVTEKYREVAVVGGTGQFRYARGFVNVSTVKIDFETGDGVLEYDVTVIHH